eukprot:scaffold95063_cov17-Tisochrysis_lutea.AAC.1
MGWKKGKECANSCRRRTASFNPQEGDYLGFYPCYMAGTLQCPNVSDCASERHPIPAISHGAQVTPCAVTEEPDPAPPNGLQQQHGDRAGSSAGASTSGQHTHSNCGQQKGRRVGGLIYPVHRGRLEHPEGLEVLLHSAFYELLGWEVDQEGSVVIAEPLFVSRRERELMAQLMFEHFNVNGLYFQDQATLALYALGMLSGMVIDIGHGKVDVSVVADGQVGGKD